MMTKRQIKLEINDLNIEITALEEQEPGLWWSEAEKARDLAQLRAQREILIARI